MNNVNHNEDHIRRPLQEAAELETLAQDSEMEMEQKFNNNCNGGKPPDDITGNPLSEDEKEIEEATPDPPSDNGASFLIILFFYFQVSGSQP